MKRTTLATAVLAAMLIAGCATTPQAPCPPARAVASEPVEDQAKKLPNKPLDGVVRQAREHHCGVVSGTDIRCWGKNGSFQLGDGTREARSRPVRVKGLPVGHAIVAMDVFERTTCVVLGDGSLWCWGSNGRRRIDARAPSVVEKPWRRATLPPVDRVVQFRRGTCVRLAASGQIQCWTERKGDAHSPFGKKAPKGKARSLVRLDQDRICAAFDDGLECWGGEPGENVELTLGGATGKWHCGRNIGLPGCIAADGTTQKLRDVYISADRVCGVSDGTRVCGVLSDGKATLRAEFKPGCHLHRSEGHPVLECNKFRYAWVSPAQQEQLRVAAERRLDGLIEEARTSPIAALAAWAHRLEMTNDDSAPWLRPLLRYISGEQPKANHPLPFATRLTDWGHCDQAVTYAVDQRRRGKWLPLVYFIQRCAEDLEANRVAQMVSAGLTPEEETWLWTRRDRLDKLAGPAAKHMEGKQLGDVAWLMKKLGQHRQLQKRAQKAAREMLKARAKDADGFWTSGPDLSVGCWVGPAVGLRRRLWKGLPGAMAKGAARSVIREVSDLAWRCPRLSGPIVEKVYREVVRLLDWAAKIKPGQDLSKEDEDRVFNATMTRFSLGDLMVAMVRTGHASLAAKTWPDAFGARRSLNLLIALDQANGADGPKLSLHPQERPFMAGWRASQGRCAEALAIAKEGPWPTQATVVPTQFWAKECVAALAAAIPATAPADVRVSALLFAGRIIDAAKLLPEVSADKRLEATASVVTAWHVKGRQETAQLAPLLHPLVTRKPKAAKP